MMLAVSEQAWCLLDVRPAHVMAWSGGSRTPHPGHPSKAMRRDQERRLPVVGGGSERPETSCWVQPQRLRGNFGRPTSDRVMIRSGSRSHVDAPGRSALGAALPECCSLVSPIVPVVRSRETQRATSPRSAQAARWYSWIRPPRRSTRAMVAVVSVTSWRGIGASRPTPRCGRAWL
jgi:hypothetical protein